MNFALSSRFTPWVVRLIAANMVVLLLMRTIFISPDLASALAFSPADALREPWTFFTYMFVHAGLLHLLGNMFMLFVFGTAVENRMGGRAFIFYYLLCGVGGAAFSLALSNIMSVGPMVGASGAVLGVALAFAMYWPDAEMIVFPSRSVRGRWSACWSEWTCSSPSLPRATASRMWRTWVVCSSAISTSGCRVSPGAAPSRRLARWNVS